MRIVHLLAPADAGGLERVVQGLAIGQRSRGHQVTVAPVVERPMRGHPFIPPLQRSDVAVREIMVPHRAYRQEQGAVATLCNELRPDVVHSHGYHTDVVNGAIGGALSTDPADFFQLTGLLAGSSFSLTALTTDLSFFANFQVFDSSQSQIGTGGSFQNGLPANVGGIVPLDGILVVNVAQSEGSGAYTVDLNAQTLEPSTLAGVGLGLTGAMALRRKRKV